MSLFDTGIRPAIDEYLQKQREALRDYGDYWSASSAGYCMRKNIFDRLRVPPTTEDARKQRVFSSGHIFHSWIQEITKDAGLSIAQELELQDEELMIRGHIDDLVLVPNPNVVITDNAKLARGKAVYDNPQHTHLILYDYKTAHSRSFTYTKGKPMSYYHKMQLGTYLLILRNDPLAITWPSVKTASLKLDLTEARILTISKDDLRMDEKQMFWSDELEAEIRKYWGDLNQYWDGYNFNGDLPPCSCADHEGGFLAREAYNPYFYKGEPCSISYFNKWKEEQ